ncbi:MAG: citrate lyase holo-[Muribaculaceae bacterium]|nr:citrate lyase holo-[acyl-carrier protein] synthase [Muribaculaceae bacterium]
MEITLDQLLASRDRRHEKQMALLSAHPRHTLVCATVAQPGPVKRNAHSLIIANAALTAVLECFRDTLVDIVVRDLATGYEIYLVTSTNQLQAKRMCCHIEDSHPLGRLMDIDVVTTDGIPMPRTIVGEQPRRCLLCDHEARYCMRARTHTSQELQQRIEQMIAEYVQ